MGEKDKGKTERAVDALKQYISSISKRDRQRIEKELEKEGDSEEESPTENVTFKTVRIISNPTIAPSTVWTTHTLSRLQVPIAWTQGEWVAEPNKQKQIIEEEAQDVDFGE